MTVMPAQDRVDVQHVVQVPFGGDDTPSGDVDKGFPADEPGTPHRAGVRPWRDRQAAPGNRDREHDRASRRSAVSGRRVFVDFALVADPSLRAAEFEAANPFLIVRGYAMTVVP